MFSFFLTSLSLFLLEIEPFLSVDLTPSEMTQIAANKSLYRSPQFGYVHFLLHPNSKLEVENTGKTYAQNYKQCAFGCARNISCLSFNFEKQPTFFYHGEAQFLCELLPTDKYHSLLMYQRRNPGFDHYSIRSNCSNSPCLHNNTCIPDYENDKYQCLCRRPAFEGKHCKDVDECATGNHDCSLNAICINTIGSFSCSCKDGFYGNGKNCYDVDECTTGKHDCSSNAICTNTISSFSCSCKDGFYGNGKNCYDVDECTTGKHDCSLNAIRTNTIGSFSCKCKDNYKGDGKICRLLFHESDILRDYGNVGYHVVLKGFMDQVPEDTNNPWIRCWSGMNDGFDVTKTFHPQCDGKGPTVTIVRKNKYIFGGYADLSWSTDGNHHSSEKSFIFSLYNIRGFDPHRFPLETSTEVALYHGLDAGPSFSNDMLIVDSMVTNFPLSYALPPGCQRLPYCNFFTGLDSMYTIDDIEVFYKHTG